MIEFGLKKKNILVLGATGLLGSAIFRLLIQQKDLNVVGSIRSAKAKYLFHKSQRQSLVICPDVSIDSNLGAIFKKVRPDIVINCISLEKGGVKKNSSIDFISTYALLPHRLTALCLESNSRLIQISTDGVFTGIKGAYQEMDTPDSNDLYGLTKYLGEPNDPNTITLRTSMIGHGLKSTNNLLDWFLSQQGSCQGYTRVIFSGLPTIVLAAIIRDYIIPNERLYGVYHLASEPISKFDLLTEVARVYHKNIKLLPVDFPVIDRSLNPTEFFLATGYKSPEWPELIKIMYEDKVKSDNYV